MPAKTKRQRIPFSVAVRDGNLLVIQTEKWQRIKPKLMLRRTSSRRPALAIFIVIAPGIGPEKWTIGWVRGDLTSAEKNTARIRTAKKNALIPLPRLPNETSWIPFIVESVTAPMLRELAMARAASIAREITRIDRWASRQCNITPRAWDIASTREKLREANVDIENRI